MDQPRKKRSKEVLASSNTANLPLPSAPPSHSTLKKAWKIGALPAGRAEVSGEEMKGLMKDVAALSNLDAAAAAGTSIDLIYNRRPLISRLLQPSSFSRNIPASSQGICQTRSCTTTLPQADADFLDGPPAHGSEVV